MENATTERTNYTAPMTKRERLERSLMKLCYSKNGPAVNYQHVDAIARKIKEMDNKMTMTKERK